ncbi:uncharacterized protein LOC107432200 [Ziziphus jujuba]|uniref:Uncharacterized protein LOC107432200 n=1 Tax=Ziziphus jujuba TaxID=326968 RepID=A0A6P4ALF4_ZIZJJ|nr:uncharacterized protein LOC107432200 [Ziziphus jujuba]
MEDIVESREELMVSPTGGNQSLRTAHFLKPSVTSVDGPVFNIPRALFLSATTTSTTKLGNFPILWWQSPQRNWKFWVRSLHSEHHLTWKKAGIYEAIMGSKYQIVKSQELVLGLAEKWCPQTNTFIFPWGEATITLEDVMVLGGYPVLGSPVLSPLGSVESKRREAKLVEARLDLLRSKSRKASQSAWLKHFMGSESEFEHEAFLSLWLSRFVFPSTFSSISKHLFPLSIHLASGTQLALAPAVLASIYKNLSSLKEKMGDSTTSKTAVNLWGPFQLVQVWVWERFVASKPKPEEIKFPSEPRIAQWNNVKAPKQEDVKFALDSAGESFLWRPYTLALNNHVLPKFYLEKEEWILVNADVEKELESFARCLRACELVGIGFVQQYFPHRVAMQFGIDQDLPGYVVGNNENYSEPLNGAMWLYVPSRFFKPNVTSRYLEWWKQSTKAEHDGKQRGKEEHQENSGSVPPGFSSKWKDVEARNYDMEDKLTVKEMLRLHHCSSDNRMAEKNGKNCLSDVRKIMKMVPVENMMQSSSESKLEITAKDDRISGVVSSSSSRVYNKARRVMDENEEESRRCHKVDSLRRSMQLEARICTLENMISQLKVARLARNKTE